METISVGHNNFFIKAELSWFKKPGLPLALRETSLPTPYIKQKNHLPS